MSKIQQLFDRVKEVALAAAPGLADLKGQAGAELQRLGTQGSMELASALFNGHGFVPYGPGQYTPDPQQQQGVHGQHEQAAHGQQQQQQARDAQERGGREM